LNRVFCLTEVLKTTQPWDFYVLKGNAYVDHDSADIMCSKCKSVLTSLYSDKKMHPASAAPGGVP